MRQTTGKITGVWTWDENFKARALELPSHDWTGDPEPNKMLHTSCVHIISRPTLFCVAVIEYCLYRTKFLYLVESPMVHHDWQN